QHVATGEVDGRRALEREGYVGLVGRDQCLHHTLDMATGHVVGFKIFGVEFKAGLDAHDLRLDDHFGRHLAKAHADQLHQRDIRLRHQGLKPESEEVEENDDAHQNGDECGDDEYETEVHADDSGLDFFD